MKVAGIFGFDRETLPTQSKGSNAPAADRRSRSSRIRWPIAYKLAAASVLMVVLTLLAGGVGLWQVLAIDQVIGDAREKELQRERSLELLAAGHRLVASLDRMLVTQDQALLSADVPVSLGYLSFYMEVLQEAGGDPEILGILEEMQGAYGELRQGVSEVDLLARQELWTETEAALEQDVRPVNERMNILLRRLVRRTDQDVEAVGRHVQRVVGQAIVLLAVLMIAAVLIAVGWRQVVFQGLSRSITELRYGVARIGGGDLAHKLDIRTGDEIEELGDEFNKMAGELSDVIGDLERRVDERTRGLRAAAEVGRATTSVLDPDQLLRRVVNLARERFDLYYVGLFLLEGDSGRSFAVLRAGTGEAGRQMMAQGHRLEVGGDSMIGQCVFRAEPRIALDVGVEAVRFDNPLLPETHSELALPLIARGRVIGAMTVQSVEEAAFDEEYIAVLQTMADQVAVAIDNARLFAESQEALAEMAAAQRRQLGQAWAEYAQTADEVGYETKRAGVAPLGDAVLPEIQRAVEHGGAAVLESAPHARSPHSALVAPVALRGEVIGALGVHGDEKGRRWSDDDIAIIEAVAERMALAAENLRLLEDSQRRASRERLTGKVAGQVRASLDPDTILKTTVRELGRALGAEMASIEITGPGEGDVDRVSPINKSRINTF